MKQFDGIESYCKNPGSILVLGMFDGIHKGHMALFEKARGVKGDNAITVFTFSNGFKNSVNYCSKSILTGREKVGVLETLDIDELITQQVDDKFINTSAEGFIELLKDKINIKGVVVGFDFTFGKDRKGTPDMLKGHFDNVYVVDKVEIDGIKVSSTYLRECITKADLEKYIEFCSRPYFISGTVTHGFKRGAQNNMPTINIVVPEDKLSLPNGVYATKVKLNGREMIAVSNLGSAPTFDRNEQFLEAHILDFNEEIYGSYVEVYFYKAIRPVKKFGNADELYGQIYKDIKFTRNFFST